MNDNATILLLVDGTCIFCNRLVSFILKRDRRRSISFAHLQGTLACALLERHGLTPDIDTIYAVTHFGEANERVHLDGEAARIIWPRLFAIVVILRFVPLWLLNLQYRLFAKVRYRLFGQANACIVPSPEDRERFLTSSDLASL